MMQSLERPVISKVELIAQLEALGVQRGGVLIVHCAFSKVRPVEGGPAGLIAALREALGPEGTLVMPSMADDDEHVFDARRSSCLHMGVVAQTFWQMPGILRTDSPHAFAALGPQAERITAPQPATVPHGHDSPVGRVYDLDGQVLLLGVGHDSNTTIHCAENMAGVRYRCYYHVLVERDSQRRARGLRRSRPLLSTVRPDGRLAGGSKAYNGAARSGMPRRGWRVRATLSAWRWNTYARMKQSSCIRAAQMRIAIWRGRACPRVKSASLYACHRPLP